MHVSLLIPEVELERAAVWPDRTCLHHAQLYGVMNQLNLFRSEPVKRKYTFMGSGLLVLAFVLWMTIASAPAAVGMMADVLLEQAGASFRLGPYGNYALLGFSELLLLVPLVGYMLICKVPVRALMGNRTTAAQNALAAALGAALAVAVAGPTVAWSSIFTELLGAKLPDTSFIEPKSWGALAAAALAVGVSAGVAEEPLFRGVVQRSLGGVTGKWPAILWSSLIFSLVHMDIVGAPTRFAVGVVMGLLAWRSGAILPGIFAHAAYNTMALATNLIVTRTPIAGWQGFTFTQSMSPAVAEIVTWCILSAPFALLYWGLWALFKRVTPANAAWSNVPGVPEPIKGAHWLGWAGVALVVLVMTALTFVTMFLPSINEMLPQIAG